MCDPGTTSGRARLALLAIIVATSFGAYAEEIATELFEYDPGELDFLEEGEGDWVGPWFADVALTEIIDTTAEPLTFGVPGGGTVSDGGRALEMIGNSDNIIFRELDFQDGDDVFISFLFRFTGQTDDNNFMGIYFDELTTGTHTDAPSIGLKANQGNGGGPLDVFARLALNGEAYSQDIVPGETYFVVGHLWKEFGGSEEPYTRFDLWVDPGIDDLDLPQAEAFGFGRSNFTQIGIRLPNFQADDTVLLAALRLGTEWEDVVPEAEAGQEICENGADDDGDGMVDCDDPDCADRQTCQPAREVCDNTEDDDEDGLVDCADPDCAAELVCQPDPCVAVRSLSSPGYQPGATVSVTLAAADVQGASQIVDTFPAGWTVSDNPDGGVVADNTIAFDLAADGEVTYAVTAPAGVCEVVTFAGTITGEGNCDGDVVGASTLRCNAPGEIVTDLFDYEPGELDFQEEGSGEWIGPWFAVPDLTEIIDTSDEPLEYDVPGGGTVSDGERALEMIGNDDNIVYRELEPQDGDDVFISFLFLFSGIVEDNNFMGISFDEVASGTHGDAPAIGLKGNQGNGSGPLDIFSRIALNGEAYAEDIFPDEPYFVVGHLYKDVPGPDQPYTNFDLWVNPAFDDPPHAQATGSGRTNFSFLTIRVPNFEPDDIARIAALRLGKSWEDVVPSDAPAEGTRFVRGDADASGSVNITDAVFILNFLFGAGQTPTCAESANADGQGAVNITDGVYILNFLFGSGAEPSAPYPDCAPLDGVDCEAFDRCN